MLPLALHTAIQEHSKCADLASPETTMISLDGIDENAELGAEHRPFLSMGVGLHPSTHKSRPAAQGSILGLCCFDGSTNDIPELGGHTAEISESRRGEIGRPGYEVLRADA
jgi:hypothetical protein